MNNLNPNLTQFIQQKRPRAGQTFGFRVKKQKKQLYAGLFPHDPAELIFLRVAFQFFHRGGDVVSQYSRGQRSAEKSVTLCFHRVTHLHECAFEQEEYPAFHRDCPLDCKVYVGNLGNNGNKTELERAFGYYGPLRSVWVARNPPGFAFVEFEDPRDASDAVRELDGRTMCGCRVRVELSTGEKRSRSRGPPPSWSRRPRDDLRRRSPPVKRSFYNCLVKCCCNLDHFKRNYGQSYKVDRFKSSLRGKVFFLIRNLIVFFARRSDIF
uniref:Serine/arginine-rich splicing factor 3 n=1 Tax=Fundulus heteroclitus TaxID=8078 RepID=A0A3Q2QPW0_FUNHE